MPFIENSQFEQHTKKEIRAQKVQQKKEQAKINTQAKVEETPKNTFTPKELKQYLKSSGKTSKPLDSIKAIKQELEVRKLVVEEKEKELEKTLENPEVQEIKDGVIRLLATPHTEPVRRVMFGRKLQESKIINKYVDNNVIMNLFSYVNDNVKFGVVYGMKYIQTIEDHNKLLALHKMNQTKQKQQAPSEVKEEVEPDLQSRTSTIVYDQD